MTSNNLTQYFGVLMSFVLIASAAGVGFVGVAVASNDTVDLEDEDRYWDGQVVEYTGENGDLIDDDVAEIVEADDGDFVTEVSVEDETITIDTASDVETGQYELHYEYDSDNTGESDSSGTVAFEVSEQTLTIEADDAHVADDEEVEFDVDSNRASFALSVSSEDLDNEDLNALFSGELKNEDEDDEYVEVASGDLSADWSALTEDDLAGEYEFAFEVVDTDAEDSATVTVADPEDTYVQFAENTFTATEGDVGELTIELSNTDEATVIIGDEDDNGYELVVDVEAEEDAEEVVLAYDTYKAGNDDSAVVEGVEDVEDITVVSETTLDNPIVPLTYDLSVGMDDGEYDENDIASFIISERSTSHADIGVLNADADYDDEDVAVNATTYHGAVAEDDYFVLEYNLNGIFGALDEAGVEDVADLEDVDGIEMNIEETEANVNVDKEEIDVDNADATFVNADEERILVVFEADETFELENEYEATLTLTEEYEYIEDEDAEEELSLLFETEERHTEFVDYNDDEDLVELEAGDEIEVVAETNHADGTEDNFVVRMTGEHPLLEEHAVESEEGEYAATLDGESFQVGDEFTVELSNADITHDGVIVEGDEPAPETYALDVTVENEDGDALDADVTVDGASDWGELEDGEYVVEASADNYESASDTVEIDGADASVTLTLEAEDDDPEPETYALDVTVENEDGDALDADVTVDGVDDMDAVEDGTYTVEVSADGYQDASTDVTVDGDDESVTLTLEEEDETPPDEEQPGFGIVVALTALLGAALLAYRRQ